MYVKLPDGLSNGKSCDDITLFIIMLLSDV